MSRYPYNPYEERILKTLTKARRPLTTSQASKFSGISYNTTREYLAGLYKRGKVYRADMGNRIYWSVYAFRIR